MNPLLNLFILAFIGSVAGIIGGVILLYHDRWAKKLALYSIPLAAGVLLAVSILDLLPESTELIGDSAFMIVLIVFLLLFVMEKFFFRIHHHEHSSRGAVETAVPVVIAGDTIHNFLDGVAIAAAFMVDPSLGLLVAFSTFLHETPHEIADFGILLAAGWTKTKALGVNFLSALATFPGAFLTYFFVDSFESSEGYLLAIAAGMFLYVATTDFLPEVGHKDRKTSLRQALILVVGIVIIIILNSITSEFGGH
jgi:zinc and cadmium transporter